MSRKLWGWVHLLAGAAILAVLVGQLGTGPFLHGLRAISGWSLAAAIGLTLVTTVCSAWRWRTVARGLGVGLRLGPATAAYYRSQFLNTVLPGGILGDVHRAVSHGLDVGDVGRGLRAVAWERSAGQVLQVALTVLVLASLPSPVRPFLPVALVALLALVLAAAVLIRAVPQAGPSRRARALRAAAADVRHGLLARQSWPSVLAASLLVIAGHTATFFVAARTAGVEAPIVQLLPLVMLVMLAMAVPTNIGGWGPREGAAAWLFGLAGLGAAQGVAAATVYGVMVLVGTLPGAVVLAGAWASSHRAQPTSAPAQVPVSSGRPTTPPRTGGVACG